jgi:hypothetical protein
MLPYDDGAYGLLVAASMCETLLLLGLKFLGEGEPEWIKWCALYDDMQRVLLVADRVE